MEALEGDMSYTYPTLKRMFELYTDNKAGLAYQRLSPNIHILRLITDDFLLTYTGHYFNNVKMMVTAECVIQRAECIHIDNEQIYLFYDPPTFRVLTTQEEAEHTLVEWIMKNL